MIEKIDKVEIDRLVKAVEKILYSEVLERDIEDRLPLVNELADANRIYRGKISVYLLIYVNQQNFQKSLIRINW